MSNDTDLDTPVLRLLNSSGVVFQVHRFEYIAGGGTSRSSQALNIPENLVVKTLVFQDHTSKPLMVLMHGHMRVDTKELARILGTKKISSCAPEAAEQWSGWPVGSTNPFVLKTCMPVYAEETIFQTERIWINGGRRGLLVEITPDVLRTVVELVPVRVGVHKVPV